MLLKKAKSSAPVRHNDPDLDWSANKDGLLGTGLMVAGATAFAVSSMIDEKSILWLIAAGAMAAGVFYLIKQKKMNKSR